ncbi:MAG: GNAT family N-acetyltransferase [Ruegeria sp.]|uniref:GNAT family N-acetyltransferase n=1 Tax=Ruegeria sp. TaxID=1879320 RepID=UPI00349E6EB8
MAKAEITPLTPDHHDEVVRLSLRAWAPVFAKTQNEVPRFVYDAFYPDGWEERQAKEVRALLNEPETECWVALVDHKLAGFVGLRLHPEDQMGEIHIVAVDPDFQGRGIGRQLMDHAEAKTREAGMQMIMVETVGDTGHAPARRAYEASGYERWPVARYFKRL